MKKTIIVAAFIFAISLTFMNCNSEKPTTPATVTPTTTVTPPVSTEPETITGNAVSYFGPLKVLGNKIVGKDNKPVQLRGMSLFWSQWMGKYYTPNCVKWLKDDWSANVIRVAMAVEEGGYLTNPAAEKQKVITVVDAAIAQGMYVIIDWHDHNATKHLKESKDFFAEMAKKYGDKPNVIYETFNEPLQISWSSAIKPYHQAVIDTIRFYDPDNLIICGTPTWSQDVDIASNDPLKGSNIAYTLHFYSGSHKQFLRDKAQNALNKGIALMVTEFGTTDASGDGMVNKDETAKWWAFLDENKISACNWSITDKTEGSAALRAGASGSGDWTVSQITESGLLVRTEMKAKNIKFK